MYRYFFLSLLFAASVFTESIAKDPGYYFTLNGGFAIPSDYTIVDTFGDGYFVEGEIGFKKSNCSLGAALICSEYSDNSFLFIHNRSKSNKLWIYNLNIRIRSEFVPERTDLNLFVVTGAGVYMADWLEKISEHIASDSLFVERAADIYGWNFEFTIGFEIPIAGKILIRSTLDFSYMPANFRRYYHGVNTIDGITREYSGINDFKSANLGGKRLGIGAVYCFDL